MSYHLGFSTSLPPLACCHTRLCSNLQAALYLHYSSVSPLSPFIPLFVSSNVGASLDVFAQEPPTEAERPLILHPKVVASPHLGANTKDAQVPTKTNLPYQHNTSAPGDPRFGSGSTSHCIPEFITAQCPT
jgi:hypothetical protein